MATMQVKSDDDGLEDWSGCMDVHPYSTQRHTSVMATDWHLAAAQQVTPGKVWRMEHGPITEAAKRPELQRLAEDTGVLISDVIAEVIEMTVQKMQLHPEIMSELTMRLAPKALENAQKRREAKAHEDAMHQRMVRDIQRAQQAAADNRKMMMQMASAPSAASSYAGHTQMKTQGLISRLFNWNG